jgi:hypothetical protein
MIFDEMLTQVLALLQREKRVSYRALKRRFDFDDDYLEDVKDELIYAKKLAVDEENRVLVWTGEQATFPFPPAVSTSERASAPAIDQEREPLSYTPKHLAEKILTSRSALEGERKQVTVLFCDLTNSTPIAERIGPEAMHALLNRFFKLAPCGRTLFRPSCAWLSSYLALKAILSARAGSWAFPHPRQLQRLGEYRGGDHHARA